MDSLYFNITLELYFYRLGDTHLPPISEGSPGFGVVGALVGVVFVVLR